MWTRFSISRCKFCENQTEMLAGTHGSWLTPRANWTFLYVNFLRFPLAGVNLIYLFLNRWLHFDAHIIQFAKTLARFIVWNMLSCMRQINFAIIWKFNQVNQSMKVFFTYFLFVIRMAECKKYATPLQNKHWLVHSNVQSMVSTLAVTDSQNKLDVPFLQVFWESTFLWL